MGLSFHYSGQIKDIALIGVLTEEVQDICTTFNWHYLLFDDDDFRGICFSPEKCEPVFLTFTPGGVLGSPVLHQLEIEPITTISVKTQFASMEVHLALMKLLKHLQARYFARFDMMDEGGYWESGDESILHQQFDRYNFLLDAVQKAFEELNAVPGETAASLADRLEAYLKEQAAKGRFS